MPEYKLAIITTAVSLNGTEINELTNVCNENNIFFMQVEQRAGLQNSVFNSIYSILVNNDLLFAISAGVISATVYDTIKTLIGKIILKAKNIKCGVKKEPIVSDLIELKTNNTILKIKSTDVTPENINKAIDAFVDIACKNNDNQHHLPTFVLVGNEIEILTLDELVEKYIKNKDDTEKQ